MFSSIVQLVFELIVKDAVPPLVSKIMEDGFTDKVSTISPCVTVMVAILSFVSTVSMYIYPTRDAKVVFSSATTFISVVPFVP